MAKGKKGRSGPPPRKPSGAKPPGPKAPGKGKPQGKGPAPAAAGSGAATKAAGQATATVASAKDGAAMHDAGAAAKKTRAERLEAERQARRRRSRLVRVALAVAVALLLGVVATVATAGRRSEAAAVKKMTTGSCRFDRKADADDGPGRNHFSGGNPTYKVNPPAGGNHLVQAAPPAVYPVNDAPPDGRVVHAMEHGFVVLWHQPQLSESDEQALRAVAERFDGNVLVIPRGGLEVPVAATAWHRRLLCTSVEQDALSRFVRTFLDKGPEKGHVKKT